MQTDDQAKSNKALVGTWMALLALLALTVGSAYLPLGAGNTIINLSISTLKAMLVAVVFMRLIVAADTTRIMALAGLFWLLIMLTLTLGDFLTR